MKTLVVGGAGYIGGVVTDALLKKKIPFTVYDNLLYEHQYLKPVDFVHGDVRNTKKLEKLLPDYTHVIWLAAIVGDAACQVNPALTVAINQDSIKWLSEHFKGKILFTSTCSVYGQHDAVVTEMSPLNPLSIYAKTKVEAEKHLAKANSMIFRLGTAFGVADTYSRLRMDLVVNYMTANAITKGKLNVFGGTQWRPLVHVKDIGETLVNNLESPASGIFNLAAVNMQIKNLAESVSRMTGCKIEYTEQKFEDQRNYHVTTEKGEKEGLFDAKKLRTIEDGVREIMELINNHRIKYTENDVYFNERHVAGLMKNGEFV